MMCTSQYLSIHWLVSTGFAELESSLQPGGLGGLQELPEEDQDEELPSLPPGKDPAVARLTSPLHNKGPAANKQMVGPTSVYRTG